jgi:1,4-alpha-glucan branching enzyme
MNKFLLLLLLLAGLANAQLITWLPYSAKDSDSIYVYFDASQGNQGLLNYTGDVYTHTGVITNLSTSSKDWKYGKTSWGQNTPDTKLDRLGANLYRYKILPSVRNFYTVPPGEQILQIAFVFRSDVPYTGTTYHEGKTVDGGDIFLPLFGSGLNVAIVAPNQFPYFSKIGDSIKVTAVSSHSTNLALYIDNSLVKQTSDSTLNYNFLVNSTGKKWVKAVATGTLGAAADSFYYIVNSPVPVQPLPAGIVDGINYTSATSVTFSLYAPGKKSVYLIGDFNNWEVDPVYNMTVTPDSSRWWFQVNNLTSQKEYVFQYLVDGTIRVADPYSEKILDPDNDRYITGTTYPNLIPYPVGKTTQIASVLQTNQTPYAWQVTNFQKPKKTDLVVYELLIRDFLATHDYKTLADTINYLKNLGVNAIELMPVEEFEGNESWGYNPSFHMALDKYYGPKQDLKAFIDKAHSLGIAVVLDIVLNHVMGSSPLARLYWDASNNRPAANNPWLNPIAKHDYNVGNDINHESSATQSYVDRVTSSWLSNYKIDGFRFDLSKGFTQTNTLGNVTNWGHYDQSRINLLERMAAKIWQVSPDAYVILEHFADNDEETVLSAFGMMLWGNMNSGYLQSAMGYTNPSADISWGSYKARGWSQPNLVSYMESHDEERMMYKNITYGNSNGTYNVKDPLTALNRVKLASAYFYTIPGPKMLWQFGELGYDISIDFNGRVGNKPIHWEYFSDVNRNDVYKVIAALTKLKQYPAFRSSNYALNVGGLWKSINITDPTMNVTVIGNFNVTSASGNPNFQNTGKWYDYLSGDSIIITNTSNLITLSPGEFHIYTSVKFPASTGGVVLNLTILLQGFYNGSSMVSDSVTVELHNAISPHTLVEAKKGILNNAGFGTFNFLTAINGTSYYIVIKHRNGVETWSATVQSFASGVLYYDFTNAQSQAYGNNLVQKGTKWCLYSGDINHDGIIDLFDLSAADNDNSNFVGGYVNTDVNGDGIVDIFDISIIDNNNASFVSKVVPSGAPAIRYDHQQFILEKTKK